MPNVGTYEPCFPQRDTTIVGNLVFSNNNPGTDAIDSAQLAFGNGILLVGAVGNTVERNQIWDHDITGVGVVPYPEDDPHAVPSKDLTTCEGKPPKAVLDVAGVDAVDRAVAVDRQPGRRQRDHRFAAASTSA